MAAENISAFVGVLNSAFENARSSIVTVITGIGGVLAIMWYCVQLWESKTVRTWVGERKRKYRVRKIARLEAQQKIIKAKLYALTLQKTAAKIGDQTVATAKQEAKNTIAETEQHLNQPPLDDEHSPPENEG